MSAQVAADLRAAADVLERDGWTQGDYHASDGCHCVVGAIEVATGYWTSSRPQHDLSVTARRETAVDVFEAVLESPADTVFDWNDAPGRTAAEVIAALRAAADRAEAES